MPVVFIKTGRYIPYRAGVEMSVVYMETGHCYISYKAGVLRCRWSSILMPAVYMKTGHCYIPYKAGVLRCRLLSLKLDIVTYLTKLGC